MATLRLADELQVTEESHEPYETKHPVTGCRYYLYPNVKLGKNVLIYQNVLLGFPPRGKKIGELELVIGDNAIIRSSSTIYAGCTIGDDFQSGHGAMIREGNHLGNRVTIGTNCVLECGNKFADNITFHTLSQGGNSTFESNCFIGPSVVFLDDPHPICPSYKECKRGPVIKEYARIGGHVTLLPGVVVGRDTLIGAGSTVIRDIPDHSVAVGNPAKVVGKVQDLKCDIGLYDKPYEWLNGANL